MSINSNTSHLSFKKILFLSTACFVFFQNEIVQADIDMPIMEMLRYYGQNFGKTYVAYETPTETEGEHSITSVETDKTYYFVFDEDDIFSTRMMDYITQGNLGFGSGHLYDGEGSSSHSRIFLQVGNKHIEQDSLTNKLTFEEVDPLASEYDYYYVNKDGLIRYYKSEASAKTTSSLTFGNSSSDHYGLYRYFGDGVVFGNNVTKNGGGLNVLDNLSADYLGMSFMNNTTTGKGGGIYNPSNFQFILLETIKNTANQGGGIYNSGNVNFLVGDFFSNTATTNGGAIYNKGNITSLEGYFNNNTAVKGAAIYNYSGKQITSLKGDFNSNSATESGGAIYNDGTVGLFADGQDITFYNNTDSTGYNDLYGGTYNLNAQSGYKIDFGGSIRNAKNLNINNDASAANRGGDYVFNNTVDAGINLYNGAIIKLTNIKQADGSTSYGVINTTKTIMVDNVAGSYIDMRNNHIDTNTVGGMTLGSNLGLSIDTDLYRNSASTSDKLLSTSATIGDGKIVIDTINLTHSAYGEGDSVSINIADNNTKGKITIADDILDNITGATNYYTKVEYDEDTGDLVFTDKLVNKSTLDQALQDAGISDMSIYAKTADVYTQTQADNKFATQESLGSYVTSSSLSTTLGDYATTDSVYTKTQADNTFAAKNNVYTKSEIDTTLGGYVTTSSLSTTLGDYATTDSVYTKTEADNKFLTEHQDISGKANVGDSYTKSESDDKYATQTAISDMLTKTEAGTTYAKANDVYTKSQVYSKGEIDTTLGGYVTTGSLSTTLGNYVLSDDLDTTLGNYVTSSTLNTTLGSYATNDSVYTKTQADNAFAAKDASYTKSESDGKYATISSLSNYATSDSVYSKTEADNKFLTEHQDISGKANVSDVYTKGQIDTTLGDYVTSSNLTSTLGSYATTDSVYTKTQADNTFATKASLNSYVTSESLGTTLNSYVTNSSLNTTLGGYVTTSNLTSTLNGYATTGSVYTKEEISTTLGSYVKISEVGDYVDLTDYAKTANVYSKTEADGKFLTEHQDISGKANVADVYTKDEINSTLGGYVTSSSLNTTLGNYATTDSVYSKTQADNTFATKSALNDYVTTSALNTTLGDYVLSDNVYTKSEMDTTLGNYALSNNVYTKTQADNTFASKEAISDMLTKTEAGNTYATKSSLDSYVKSDDLNTTLNGYVTTGDLNTTLGSYATTDSVDTKLQDYALSDSVYTKSEVDTTLGNYVTSDNLTTTLSGYATTDSVYTKTEMNTKLGEYVKSDTLSTTLSDYVKSDDLNNTLDNYATKASLNDYVKSDDLTATLGNYATTDSVYSKTEADEKFATQNAISDMLTKTEAGNTYVTQSALNDYKTSNDNAVSALTGKMTQAETDISGIKGSAVMSSGITAEKVAAYEGYAALIDAKQDALSTEQMAVLNSGVTAEDVTTVRNASAKINEMNEKIDNFSTDFGDIADFTGSTTKNISNGGDTNATTVTGAIANIDATMGQIHGLAEKIGTENGGDNLGQNTTVEEHLTALAGSIGDRSNYTEQNYIHNNESVASSLDNLDVAVGRVHNDLKNAQAANEARFNNIETKINKLEDKMGKGLAANNALAALVPLSPCYRTQLSAAMGGYESNQAFAVGAFHYIDNNVLLNTGVAYGGRDSMSYNVGFTIGF